MKRNLLKWLGAVVVVVFLANCTRTGGSGGGGGGGSTAPTWTVMVYIVADTNEGADENIGDLSEAAKDDLNEMEASTGSPYLNVIVQVDTNTVNIGGSNTAKRLKIVPDSDVNNVTSPILQDLGEINSADPLAVVDFVQWAKANYPAGRYVLVLWDHGGNWNGGYASDNNYKPVQGIDYQELKNMLSAITSGGVNKLDLVGWDACLMGSLEIDTLCAPYANYMVASAETTPGSGWNYTPMLNAIANNPSISIPQLGTTIVNSTISTWITEDEKGQTMSLVDLSKVADVVSAIDNLSLGMTSVLPGNQDFFNPRRLSTEYDKEPMEPSKFIDLRDFVGRVMNNTTDITIQSECQTLISRIDEAIIAKQEIDRPSHGGMSIYFPNTGGIDPNYPLLVDLAQQTNWDEFVVAYQNALASDTTPPTVTITGWSSTTVSVASPVIISYDVIASDLVYVNAEITIPDSPAPGYYLDLGTIPLTDTAGSDAVQWDSQMFCIYDGVNLLVIPAFIVEPSNNLYVAFIRDVTESKDLIMVLWLDFSTGNGLVLGFLEFTANGQVAGIDVDGDGIQMLYPYFDSITGVFVDLAPSTSSITYNAVTTSIVEAPLPSGNYDFYIVAEDYAENIGSDAITLTVP